MLKFLIDTGANKSYISPEHVHRTKITDRPAIVTNKNGKFIIDKMVHINIFPRVSNEKLPFHVFKFHEFFDGLIGYENLAAMKAKIDSGNHQLLIKNIQYPLSKYYPRSWNFHEQTEELAEICTTSDGTFLIENELNLTTGVTLQPGLYAAKNNRATVHLFSTKRAKLNEIKPLENERYFLNQHETCPRLNFPADHLSREEVKLLAKTLQPYKSIFYQEGQKLDFTHQVKHKIETTDSNPIHQRTYKYPYHLREIVSDHIQTMLESGIIRESSSAWTSPIWVVPKKADNSGVKKYRIVVDYRKLNKVTPADRYPIPEISEILDRLGKAQYFSVLDLASGFHQIEVEPADIPKTAFNVDNGKYEFVRMPFGLKNAPATFQRLMDSVLRKHLGVRCFVYMDDIIIFSSSLEEHMKDIQKVLKTLKEANLKIQCDKSEFLRKEVEFLGHVVTTEGVKPNPKKVEAVENWPLPKTPKELKSFLGTISYYRRFIPGFAQIAKPMTSMLRGKNKLIVSTPEYEEAFAKLKEIMSSKLLLIYPDFDKPFILTTDASNYAIGAVLTQLVDGHERPIAYLSRTLSKAEEKYSATAKELLAIYFAAKKFRPYLYGKKFTIYTDHEPLTKEIKLTDATGRVTRQRLYLEQFDFELIYKKGKQNVVADGLSRIPRVDEVNLQTVLENELFENDPIYGPEIINKFKNQLIMHISQDKKKSPHIFYSVFSGFSRHIFHQEEYTEDQLLQILKKYLAPGMTNGIFAHPSVAKLCFKIINDNFKGMKVQFCNLKLPDLITKKDQDEFVRKTHNFNHRSWKLNYEELRQSVFFPDMISIVKNFAKNCQDCKFAKYERHPFKIPITRRTYEKPLENIFIDVYVKEGEKFLTVIDSFSKFAQLYKISSETSEELIETLIKYFKTFGIPKLITCDQATSFRSQNFKTFLEENGVAVHYASSSNSNGIIERFHNTLLEMFMANRSKINNLTLYQGLSLITALYNDAKHTTTNLTPRQIIFGNSTSLDLKDINMMKQQIIQTAKDNIARIATRHNSKIVETDKDYQDIENKEILAKTKAKPSPYSNRYRLVEVKEQNDKTITDTTDIKIHKKNLKL